MTLFYMFKYTHTQALFLNLPESLLCVLQQLVAQWPETRLARVDKERSPRVEGIRSRSEPMIEDRQRDSLREACALDKLTEPIIVRLDCVHEHDHIAEANIASNVARLTSRSSSVWSI